MHYELHYGFQCEENSLGCDIGQVTSLFEALAEVWTGDLCALQIWDSVLPNSWNPTLGFHLITGTNLWWLSYLGAQVWLYVLDHFQCIQRAIITMQERKLQVPLR